MTFGFVIETPYVRDLTKKTSGVYLLVNQINNKCYIGSSVDVKRRLREHRSGKGNGLVARAVKKYGKEAVVGYLIEMCSRENLLIRESFWMKNLPTDYNLIPLKENGRKEYTEEHKQKLTDHFKGKTLSKEHREKIRRSLKGVAFTEERKENIRRARLGKPLSEDHKAALRLDNKQKREKKNAS